MQGNYPVSVGLTATQAVNYDKERSSLVIFNNSTTATVYYGFDSGLDSANGVPIPPRSGMSFSRDTGDNPKIARYLVSTAAATDVRIGEERAGEV